MQAFFDSDGFFYVMVVAFAAYAAYFLHSIVKYYYANIEARKQFIAENKGEKVTHYDHYQVWAAVYLAFVLYCIYSFFTLDPRIYQYAWFRMAFLFVGLILLGQVMICIVKRRALVSSRGFVYEDKQVLWRSVINMEPKKKGLQRKIDVLTSSAGTLEVPVNLGRELHYEHEQYRKEKKALKEEKKKYE